MRALCRRNAAPVDSGRDFNVHMSRVIADLERHLSGTVVEPVADAVPSPDGQRTTAQADAIPNATTERAERDWERFGIAETEDVEVIEAYIAQYERSEPLWAVRARQRLAEVQALLKAREAEARREAERRAAEEREPKRQQEKTRPEMEASAEELRRLFEEKQHLFQAWTASDSYEHVRKQEPEKQGNLPWDIEYWNAGGIEYSNVLDNPTGVALEPNDPSTWGRVSRNARCPCGSGKKYKHCHGKFQK
jgi:hypothetical protein